MNKGLKNSLIFEMTCNTDGSMLFAASEVGPWVYIVAKDMWYDLSGLSAPQQTYWGVDYIPALRTARFSTDGRGIWDFKIGTFSGVEDIVADGGISVSVYPNPCQERLFVSVDNMNQSELLITLLTLDGRMIKTERPASGSTVEVDMSGLPAGVYLVAVSNGKERKVVKVVRE
jgi:hypothetical protein